VNALSLLALLMAALPDAAAVPVEVPAEETADDPFMMSGYVEGYYQWSFHAPSNGISNFRGFDNRHNSITLENAALTASWDAENVVGRVELRHDQADGDMFFGGDVEGDGEVVPFVANRTSQDTLTVAAVAWF
jgi:hypothetical protein